MQWGTHAALWVVWVGPGRMGTPTPTLGGELRTTLPTGLGSSHELRSAASRVQIFTLHGSRGLGFRVQGLGFRVQGSRSRA